MTDDAAPPLGTTPADTPATPASPGTQPSAPDVPATSAPSAPELPAVASTDAAVAPTTPDAPTASTTDAPADSNASATAPTTQPAAPASPPWTPPETFADRFSRWSVRAVRGAVATFGLVSLVLFVLWLIPTIAVSRSDAYRLACERVSGDRMLQQYAGAPIVCDRLPTWYDVRAADDQRFRFDAQGSSGSLEVEVRVKAGKAEVVSAYLGARGF